VPTATIENGGTLAPGDSIGVLTVNGDLHFDAGSTYAVETTADPSDITWANGLFGSGATVLVQPGGSVRYHPITQYGILGAPGAGPGVFTSALSEAGYLDPSLQYGSDLVYLTLRRNDVDFRSAGTYGNQSAVALALNGLVRTATGAMANVINTVYDLPNDRAVAAMGSMSGVVHQHTVASSIADAQTFMDVNMAHLGQVAGRDGAPAASETLSGLFANDASDDTGRGAGQGAWFSGVGRATRYAATAGDPSARASTVGFAVGYDAAISRGLTVGASAARSTPSLQLDGVSDQATSRMVHAGAYGRYRHDTWQLAGIVGGSSATNDTARLVTDGLARFDAQAHYGGSDFFSRIQYGHTLAIGRAVRVEPEIGFQYVRARVDGFTEQGADVLSLVVPGRRVSSERSIIGARADRRFGSPTGFDTTLEVRAGWAHEFNPFGAVQMQFLGDTANNAFSLTSPARMHNSAVLGASVGGNVFRRVRFVTSIDGDLSGAIKLWTASAGLRAAW
jgi:outer membrane autotransporter protein